MKRYFTDGIVGFVIAALFFFVVPLIWHGGAWGILNYGPFSYFLLGLFIFLFYSQVPFYKRRHGKGVKEFSLTLLSFLAGALIGYEAVLFLAAFSVSQWNPAF